MEHNNFKLCGGTLFALLTNAKSSKKKSIGNTKGYSQEALMLELVKIYNPNTLGGDTFKKDTSKYKNCIIDDSNSFDFFNQDLINEFDSEIKNNYQDKLNQMNKLISYFFEIKNEPIMNKLVRSILDLIKKDTSIPNNAKFYINPDGKPTTKVAMLINETFYLSSFILGVFHYIIVNKINNTLGKQTYDKWYSVPGNNKQHTFISDIGNKYKKIKVVVDVETTEVELTEEEPEPEKISQDNVIYEDNLHENKIINVNYQIGRNNFNNIGSLTFIDKD